MVRPRPCKARVVGRSALALALLASLVGCGEAAPSLSAGTVTLNLSASEKIGCGPDGFTERIDTRTLSLETPLRAQVSVGGNLASLEAAAAPATQTLTFSGHVARRCGYNCDGGVARAAFRWDGTLTLPDTAPTWNVRFTISALHTAPDRPQLPAGQCVLETPWRSPIVIDAPLLERSVIAPAGSAPLRVRCDSQNPARGLVTVACIGAARNVPPLEISPVWIEARLTIRVDATPR